MAVVRPCREELEALVRHYHHVESEHERAHPEGSVRHHLGLQLREDRDRFEHLLAEYVPDETARAAWRAFLHHRGGEPSGPPAIQPIVFKGRSDSGSVLEARTEWIEGPAPAEDSSVPPEPAATPPAPMEPR
jgi:hypothetical protein